MDAVPLVEPSRPKTATLRWRAIGKETCSLAVDEEDGQVEVVKTLSSKRKSDDAETVDVVEELDRSPPLTLQWTNLELRVPVQNAEEMEEKVILEAASGEALPGELLAVMGPSGAGKSSLLDCISGRNAAATGSITVDGAPWTPRLKKLASYALQDDLFHGTLTVEEHLMLQARLRMGRHATAQQRKARVNAVLEELGLTKSRHTLIGGWMMRGISGGERKRLAFATEILTNPSVLFVDEPTSGLDSCMAKAVMTQLKQLAVRDGRTVIAAIHQPSSEVFALFDKLYLLADGATIFHGRASDSISYFASLGMQCPTFINPADYFMDQLVIMDRDSDPEGVRRLEALKNAWKTAPLTKVFPSAVVYENPAPAWSPPKIDVVVYVPDEPVKAELPSSGPGKQHLGEVTSPLLSVEDDSLEDRRLPFWSQVRVLAQRNALRLFRDRMALRLQVIQTLVFAALLGAIYFQLDLNQQGIGNFAGAFFYIVTDQVYSASMPGIISVPVELPMVYRERQVGLYSVTSWFVAKNLCELPAQVFLPTIELVPIYLLLGISSPHSGGFGVFASMLALLVALNSCCVALGYAVSCVCRRVDIAPIVGNIIIMPLLLLGGLFVDVDAVPYALRWIEHVTPFKYGYYGFMRVFWRSVSSISCEDGAECWATTGADVLAKYNIADHSVWTDISTLVFLSVAFRLAGLVALQLSVRSR